MSEDPRLERIEKKIDDLSEAFIILARTEEKLATIERDRIDTQKRLERIEERLGVIKEKVEKTSGITGVIDKAFWLVVASGIGGILATVFK